MSAAAAGKQKYLIGILQRVDFLYWVLRAHSEAVTIREQWFEIFEDLEKEYAKKVSLLLAALKKLKERSLRTEGRSLAKNTDLRRQLYQTAAALEEEQGKKWQETGRAARP